LTFVIKDAADTVGQLPRNLKSWKSGAAIADALDGAVALAAEIVFVAAVVAVMSMPAGVAAVSSGGVPASPSS
jgi:hypothetical protein